ncbi:hypothetical protein [Rhizobium mayense]|uniref:HEPN domain-containing protein n=1 Tax=Rhizobium mayense TaxID=1312184 RepID=A0ABT7K394_9HYPH|nr:hypothetical protein [Rhizobium mayense]MDL2403079.1 hypothetical protein [Rhizobium mayense]
MAYRQDLISAARRHLRSAQRLYETSAAGDQPGCKAVAGYLFGLAGELALKAAMRNSGMAQLSKEERRSDPFFAHFPALKTLLLDSAKGRRAGELVKLAEQSQLFQNWDTDMRYAPTDDIQLTWVDAWKTSAEDLVQRMDIA